VSAVDVPLRADEALALLEAPLRPADRNGPHGTARVRLMNALEQAGVPAETIVRASSRGVADGRGRAVSTRI
jgi:hypothetical protein